MSRLQIIAKEATEIAKKNQELSDQIKDLLITGTNNPDQIIDPLIFAITIFTLACFIGYYVVWKVTPALHTPLMSITNAISGAIIIGSMIAVGTDGLTVSSILAGVATFFASVNIAGGFIVTERMIRMFKS
jgi:NAD(P) transhydrogenase subunit alpha